MTKITSYLILMDMNNKISKKLRFLLILTLLLSLITSKYSEFFNEITIVTLLLYVSYSVFILLLIILNSISKVIRYGNLEAMNMINDFKEKKKELEVIIKEYLEK